MSDPTARKVYDAELSAAKSQVYEYFAKHRFNKCGIEKTRGIMQKETQPTGYIMIENKNSQELSPIRLKWKRWGWLLSILAVIVILISMVKPDPEKALQGKLAVDREAERDRKALEIQVREAQSRPGLNTEKPVEQPKQPDSK